jgi:hypothetical protein
MKISVKNYEEFISFCRSMYDCENSKPGESRVTFLEFNLIFFQLFYIIFYNFIFFYFYYYFIFVFYFYIIFLLSYNRFQTYSKNIGYLKVVNINSYYAFMKIKNILHGIQNFSIFEEDWIALSTTEKITKEEIKAYQYKLELNEKNKERNLKKIMIIY